jgi:hypothetical protein
MILFKNSTYQNQIFIPLFPGFESIYITWAIFNEFDTRWINEEIGKLYYFNKIFKELDSDTGISKT